MSRETGAQARGKEGRLANFLVACRKEEARYEELPLEQRRQVDNGRWPEASDDHGPASLSDLVTDLCSWYGLNYSLLKSKAPSGEGIPADVLGPFLRLVLDLKTIIVSKTGEAIPPFDPELAEQEQAPLWALLAEHLAQHLESYAECVFAYLAWTHETTRSTDEVEQSGASSLGRYIGVLQRFQRLKDSERGPDWRVTAIGGSGREGFRSGRGRSGEGKRSAKDGNRDGNRSGNRDANRDGNRGGNRTGNREAYKDGNRDGKRGGGRGRSAGRGGPHAGPASNDGSREKEALREADQAIQKIKGQGLSEVLLAPQNSFIRRQQHQLIVDSGLYSESAGQGAKRAVKVLRDASRKSNG